MSRQRPSIITVLCAIVLVIVGIGARATTRQEEKNSPKDRNHGIIHEEHGTAIGHDPSAHHPMELAYAGHDQGDAMTFISSEMSFDLKVVKGAPYSAQAVTEHTQVLSDGNRIVRKTTGSVFRDNEGRTRREQTLAAIGPSTASGEQPRTIIIHDPVAGINYILDPQARSARKLEFKLYEGGNSAGLEESHRKAESLHRSVEEVHRGVEVRTIVNDGFVSTETQKLRFPEPKTESLGKQSMEGVEVEGTRSIVTIPAGEVGNERAIEIVSERWYSPALQTVVMSKHNDPRVGENIFRLTNISQGEPSRSLFEVPADFTVTDQPAGKEIRVMKKEKPGKDY